ncbi:MAG: hypothetical protein AAF960_00490 [Bacteroidota bacterium]
MESTQVPTIVLLIHFLGIFLGLTLGPFLLFNESAKNKANRYLGILILTVTIYFFPFLF